jgi:hypothetical protein
MKWALLLAWARANKRTASVGTVALVAAIAGSAFAFCRPQPNPVPVKEAKTGDSLKATLPDFVARSDSIQHTAATIVTKTVHDSIVVAVDGTRADSLQKIVDSALTIARAAHDTASAAFVAARNANAEAAQLRSDRDLLAADLTKANATIDDQRAQLARDLTRINVSEAPKTGLNDRLAHDVQTANQCRVLLLFACPSRKTSFAAGVVGTLAVGAAVHFHKQLGLP